MLHQLKWGCRAGAGATGFSTCFTASLCAALDCEYKFVRSRPETAIGNTEIPGAFAVIDGEPMEGADALRMPAAESVLEVFKRSRREIEGTARTGMRAGKTAK